MDLKKTSTMDKERNSLMNRITQDAKKRHGVVEWGKKHGKSDAARKYGVSLSSVKRWCKRHDGTWQSLAELSHKPYGHPKQHTPEEEAAIKASFSKEFSRYGWDGVYVELTKNHAYTRSFGGMYHAAARMGIGGRGKRERPKRAARRYPELSIPGEKVQIDVKEVPYCCLKGAAKRDGKHLCQWTAIDECTRLRYVYGYEEHTPENSVDFLRRAREAFSFPILSVQTDNGTEFTYRFISQDKKCPFEQELGRLGIEHKLIPPRTPWHNGKVERSHRNDQRYFYDWEKFGCVDELNELLKGHLQWSNNKAMRVLGNKTPLQRRDELMPLA